MRKLLLPFYLIHCLAHGQSIRYSPGSLYTGLGAYSHQFTQSFSFLANQASEWLSLDFTPSTHAYGSIFYLLTGFHGIHVLGGVVAMGALLGRMASPIDDPGAVPVVQVIGYYWHFVDAVWIAVFATVFFVR